MTLRKFLILTAVGCLLVAAISYAGLDWFGLADRDIREDAVAWGFLGLAIFAASAYPATWLDKEYFR